MKEIDYNFQWESDRNAACDLCLMWKRKLGRLGVCGLTRKVTAETSVCEAFINLNFKPKKNEEK